MVGFYRRALRKLDKLDMQQRRQLLVSAVEEINLLETVADSIDVGILVCDKKDKLVMVNKCALRLLPLNYSEGVLIWSAIKDEKIAEFLKNIFLNSERVIGREIDVIKAERNRLLSFNIVPLVQDRRVKGTLVYIEDITEKRKVEERLRRAENLASLTTLAAGVAHEIKNPLASISIHLQLLKKTLAKINHSEKKTDKYLDVINEEMNRLNSIIIDFLFAVRPVPMELRMGNINELLSQLMDFVKAEMEQYKILCLLELDNNVPPFLMDERLLKQAFLNLIKNAQAAMSKGGVLTIATNYIENEIRVQVIDTGTGISKENLAKIFEPYFTTKETGTGLGLTQVYKIIREHQGEITVDSEPQTGTEFRIVLPVPQKETRMITFKE